MTKSYQKLTAKDKENFENSGFILKPSFFSDEEIELLYNTAVNDEVIQKKTVGRADSEGNKTNLALWYSLDDSLYSLMARSERMVSGVELLLGGEPGHFHSKLMQKEPKVGGAWEWHQDYGYWYEEEGFFLPTMLSAMTAFTPCTKENGCLQVIKSSHKIGRINHGTTGSQKGADKERVDIALERFDHQYVEMEPGDTLFFHSNLLHRSDMNRSNNPRWSLITAYNLTSNKPIKSDNTSSYQPIDIVPNTAILESEPKGISEGSDFLNE